jgi:hypothetical protein
MLQQLLTCHKGLLTQAPSPTAAAAQLWLLLLPQLPQYCC